MKKCVCDVYSCVHNMCVYVFKGQWECERERGSQSSTCTGKNVIRFRAFWKMYMPTVFFIKKTHINQKQITKFIVYNKSCKNLIPKLIFFFWSVFRIKIEIYPLVMKHYSNLIEISVKLYIRAGNYRIN